MKTVPIISIVMVMCMKKCMDKQRKYKFGREKQTASCFPMRIFRKLRKTIIIMKK